MSEFASPMVSESGELACPYCGDDGYLHHDLVQVYSREREDSDSGIHATVSSKHLSAYADKDMRKNPSSRRDGITISFWCETCDSTYLLTISQDRGKTYLGWQQS